MHIHLSQSTHILALEETVSSACLWRGKWELEVGGKVIFGDFKKTHKVPLWA